jgi:predicted permease
MLNIFLIVLPVFLVIFIGKLLKVFKLIDDSFISVSNKLVFKICLPFLLFYKISSADIKTVIDLKIIFIMYLSVLLVFFLSFVLGKFLSIDDSTIGSMMMNAFRSNFAYLGLPVCYYAFGDMGLLSASVLMAFIVPYVNMLSVFSLLLFNKKQSFLKILKNIILNPLVIASILGMFVSLSNVICRCLY